MQRTIGGQVVTAMLERLALTAVRDLMPACKTIRNGRVIAMARRLGVLGDEAITLQEAGAACGLTRERFRQLQAELEEALPIRSKIPAEVLAGARLLVTSLERGNQDLDSVLSEHALSEGRFTAMSLGRLAALWGKSTGVTVARRASRLNDAQPLYVREGSPLEERWTDVLDGTKEIAGRLHLISVASATEALTRQPGLESLTDVEVAAALRCSGKWLELGESWFWLKRPHGRCGLLNVSVSMLSVAGELPVHSLREGLRRRQAGRSWTPPPASRILRLFYAQHPDFELVEDSVTLAATAPRADLSRSAETIVEIFGAAQGGVLTRAEFLQAARERGLKTASANHYITYDPLIENVAHNIWALRGTKADPGLVEAKRERAKAVRQPKEVASGVSAHGHPWFACRLRRIELDSAVLHLDELTSALLGDTRFLILNDASDGHWHLKATGTMLYGLSGFFARFEPEPGDVIRVDFDLGDGSVVLELGGEELLG